MIRKSTLILSLLLAGFYSELSAQAVYFSGVGRALFSSEGMVDRTNEASRLRSSGGYSMLDLGIYAEPDEVLRANVILRQRNDFGGFFDNGTLLEFRQMQLEGLIAKKVKFELGDIYLEHTPYTLYNDEDLFYDYESDLFTIRRDIAFYENFFVGNKWRMQGINTKAEIVNFEKGIDALGLRFYGGRTRQTDFANIPDRYFYGGRVDVMQSKNFRISGNVAGVSDITGTVAESEVDYDNLVYTTDFRLDFGDSSNVALALKGEAGGSRFELSRVSDSSNGKFNGFFYDIGAEATYKPLNLTVGVSYRDVDYDFNSPMAQTRRLSEPSDISLMIFPTMNDDVTNRPLTLFDRYGQESNIYNQSISTTLMNYYIQYDMVEPYGRATPNRKGLTFDAKINDAKEFVNASIEVNLLSEGISEGDSVTRAKREFTLVRGGFDLNINKLLTFEKQITLSTGVRLESSKRDGTNPIDLSSTMIDLGLNVEVMKDFHLLGGAKLFSVKGTELQTGRNELNEIITFSPATFDQDQNIYAFGLRYDYDKKAYFSVQGHFLRYDDAIVETTQFELNQLFAVFGLKF